MDSGLASAIATDEAPSTGRKANKLRHVDTAFDHSQQSCNISVQSFAVAVICSNRTVCGCKCTAALIIIIQLVPNLILKTCHAHHVGIMLARANTAVTVTEWPDGTGEDANFENSLQGRVTSRARGGGMQSCQRGCDGRHMASCSTVTM